LADNYDVVIVGGGLAGMTAGMYAARYGLKTGLVERMMGGASIINIEKIDNFPGFPDGISGAELAPAVQEQAMNAGVDFVLGETSSISRQGDYRVVATDAGEIRAKAVIVAAGSTLTQLGIPGEEEFFGRGVSQCATCDGPLYMRQVVGVVGGGDSAADEALTLTEYAGKVLLFHRREQLRAHRALQDRVAKNPKIEMVWNSTVQEVLGETTVSGVRVTNTITGIENAIGLTGLFVYVGLEPNSGFVSGVTKVDRAGHIPVNVSMETETPGVYAVGDIRQHSSSQLVSAAGDGATAAVAAFKYIGAKSWA
jgi:thioredoxin reductase (NADPH)